MKKTLLGLSILTLASIGYCSDESFGVGLTLAQPIIITEISSLNFATVVGSQVANEVIAPTDPNAAVFSVTAEANTNVVGQIVETSLVMTTGNGVGTQKQITVDTFTTGGDMSNIGVATISNAGDLSNLRVGATAHIEAEDISGAYAGAATFRLLYQ